MNEAPNPKPQASLFELKGGYPKGCLLPTVTIVFGFAVCAYVARHLCIEGTALDNQSRISGPNAANYYDAQHDYNEGNFDSAASSVGKILARQPNHPGANQLMARIALARGDRAAALDHLRRCLDTSLNREEVTKWISEIESSQSK